MSYAQRTVLVLALALAAAGLAAAQAPPPEVKGDRSSLWNLLFLRGTLVNVSYTPGSLARAYEAQQKFEQVSRQIAVWSKRSNPLSVQVLSRDEWRLVGMTLPYGFPARLPGRVLAIAAHGDQETVDLWRGLLDGPLPQVESSPLTEDPEQAASLAVSDVLAQVEAARLLLEKAEIYGEELWIGELMAHLAALGVWRDRDPGALALMTGMERAWAVEGSLQMADYKPGIGMGEWLAFQAAFQSGARAAGGKRPGKAAARMLRLARRNGGQLDEPSLLKGFPELVEWRRRSFRETP